MDLNLKPWCPSCECSMAGPSTTSTNCPHCETPLILVALTDREQDQRAATRGRMGSTGWMAFVTKASIKKRRP